MANGLIFYNGAYVPRSVRLLPVGNNVVQLQNNNLLLAANNLSDVDDLAVAKQVLGIQSSSDAIWNANRILGTEVDDTDKADTKVLSFDEDSNKIVWATKGSSSGGYRNITPADSGITLPVEFDNYFVSLSFGFSYSVTLPDADLMVGRELTFVNVSNVYEAWFSINGPIHGGSSYSLAGYHTLKILCDGTSWWVTATFSNS